jgi:RHS repeat-associated protein
MNPKHDVEAPQVPNPRVPTFPSFPAFEPLGSEAPHSTAPIETLRFPASMAQSLAGCALPISDALNRGTVAEPTSGTSLHAGAALLDAPQIGTPQHFSILNPQLDMGHLVGGYGQSGQPVSTGEQFRPSPRGDGSLIVDPEIHLPSPGMDVDISYFFNSNSPFDSPFGYGRTISLNLSARSMEMPAVGTDPPRLMVEMVRGNGTLVSYLQDSSGIFQPQTPRLLNSLVQDGDFWRETTPDGRVLLYPLLEPGQPCPIQSVTDAFGNQHSWNYSGGYISSLQDAVGRKVTLTYDSTTALLSTIKDWASRVTTFTYDLDTAPGKSLLSTVMGPTLCVTEYSYNSDGKLTGITDPNGVTTTYAYDSAGRVSGRTIVGTGSWSYTYPAGQMVVSGPNSVVVTQTVDSSGDIDGMRDAAGRGTSFTYNSRGLETSRQYGDGGIFTTVYDASGIFPARLIDPLGQITTIRRDTYGNPTSYYYADGSREDMLWGVPGTFDTDGSKRRMQAHISFPNVGTFGVQLRTSFTYNSLGQIQDVQDPKGFITSYDYDSVGNLQTLVNSEGNTTTFSHDAAGNLTRIKNALGANTDFTYDKQSRLTSVKDALSHVWTFAYDGVGNMVAQIDPLGHQTTTTYNAYDEPFKMTSALGSVSYFNYDAQGRRTKYRDSLGNSTTVLYDASGRVTATVDALNQVTSTLYDAVGRPNVTIDATGAVTTTLYDKAWRPYATIDPLGKVTTITYDPNNRPMAITDALGRVTTTLYDGVGRPTTFIDALGQTTVVAYDKRSSPVSITDPLLQTRTMTYDSMGRLQSVRAPFNRVTTFSYDPVGRPVSVQDPRGNIWTSVYDAAGRLTGRIDPLGNRSTLAYDAANRPTTFLNALGQLSTSIYDDEDRLINLVSPLGFTTTFQYDDAGRRTSVTDPNFNQTLFFYDAINQVQGVRAPNFQRTSFTYDGVGRLKSVTDANNHITTMQYDPRGSLLWQQDGLGRYTTYTYDAVGNARSQKDPRGLVTTMQYDALDRLTTLIYQGGVTTTVAFDAADRLKGMTDASGRTTYTYDAADRLTTVAYPIGGTITYTYDVADNRRGMVDRDGQTTSYVYDANNRLTWMRNPLAEVTTFSYDALNRETGRVFADGMTMQCAFDGDGRITTLTYQSPSFTALTTMAYDKVGNMVRSSESDGAVTSYTYDRADQLIYERRSGALAYRRDYSYDAVGNRETVKIGTVITTSTYDAANQLQTQFDGTTLTTFTYDGAGNRALQNAGGNLTTYTWNQENRLTTLKTPDGTTQVMLYAGDSDLRQQTVNGVVTQYLRDGENLLQEVNGASGVTLRSYTDFPGEWGGLTSVSEPGTGGVNRFFAFDRMGSTRLMLDGTGDVKDELLFTAFGEQLRATGSDVKRFGYEGAFGYLRLNNDLMWVRERVYDAKTGVWLGQDPIGFEGGDWNLFGYSNNRPTYQVDPDGLDPNGNRRVGPQPGDAEYDDWWEQHRGRPAPTVNTEHWPNQQNAIQWPDLFTEFAIGSKPYTSIRRFDSKSAFTKQFRMNNELLDSELITVKTAMISGKRSGSIGISIGLNQVFDDYLTVRTRGILPGPLIRKYTGLKVGQVGNMTQVFMGSWNGKWKVIRGKKWKDSLGHTHGCFEYEVEITNGSGLESLTRNPITRGSLLNDREQKNVPLNTVTQIITWRSLFSW